MGSTGPHRATKKTGSKSENPAPPWGDLACANRMEWLAMADNIKYIDVDDEQFEDAPKALRDAYKALRKQTEAVVAERDGVRSQLASKSLADVLGSKDFKNPKRVEQDILRDGIDPLDNEAVEAWLADNSDDYASGAEGQKPDPVQTEQQKAFEQIAAVQGGATNPSSLSRWELVQQEITPEMDGEAVKALYAKRGI